MQEKKTNVIIENHEARQKCLEDGEISWKAKGIFCMLWAISEENAIITADKLTEYSTDGRDSIRSGMVELEKAGYLERKYVRTCRGCIVMQEYHLI